jgi:SAM-dependent methyltransferase
VPGSGPDFHGSETPSDWVVRWAPLVTRGPVLDVASGQGRHARYFAGKGLEAVAVDREPQVLEGIKFVAADLEGGNAWPFAGQRFGAIVVTNYLYRPLFGHLEASLQKGGVLIYETFMSGNEKFGRPSNPVFLLQPGELLGAFKALTLVAFEQGIVERPKKAAIQRLCAIRAPVGSAKIAS